MTITAHLIHVLDDGATSDLGEYAFAAPPTAGDQIVIRGLSDSLDVFRVNFIEHDPVPVVRSLAARIEPRMTVFMTLVGNVD